MSTHLRKPLLKRLDSFPPHLLLGTAQIYSIKEMMTKVFLCRSKSKDRAEAPFLEKGPVRDSCWMSERARMSAMQAYRIDAPEKYLKQAQNQSKSNVS